MTEDPLGPYLAAYRRQVPDWQQREARAQARRNEAEARETDPRRLYINLLRRALTGLTGEHLRTATMRFQDGDVDVRVLEDRLRRERGGDWPVEAQTMIGLDRLENIESCIECLIADGIEGDLIETGVWRGGATIFMRGLLKAYGVTDRQVWVADSFAGLPVPDTRFPADADDWFHQAEFLRVPRDVVEGNFSRYHLLDSQVRFLEGYFEDTLPTVRNRTWSLLRLDGDQYKSTMDALVNLYPGLSPGGFVIIDDYGAVTACKEAVDDFRRCQAISDPVDWIDWSGVFWRRSR